MDYSIISKGYNELYKEEQLKKINLIKKYLNIKPTDKLLDIGAGTGISTNFFNCGCVGVEPCRLLLMQGKNIIEARAEKLPFKDKSFNIILSLTSIHHFDLKKSIKEIKRVSKPNAKIIISILKRANKFNEIKKELLINFKLNKEIEEEKDFIYFLTL
ncbi:MAG: methyltransferase domain-containing protein [Nanoarchaeota archaeon]|nr:methyltransferase domain-containing protein [Nanoarchaeota archaeon]